MSADDDGVSNGSSWVRSVAECRTVNHHSTNHPKTHDAHTVSRPPPYSSSSLVAVLPTTKHVVWCAWACGTMCHVEQITSPSSSSSSSPSPSSEPFHETLPSATNDTHKKDANNNYMEDHTVRWCQMELNSEIQAVVLTTLLTTTSSTSMASSKNVASASSDGHVPFLLIVVTRDGRLWRWHFSCCDNYPPTTCIRSSSSSSSSNHSEYATGITRHPTMQMAIPITVVPPTVPPPPPPPRSRISTFGNERQSSHDLLDTSFATHTFKSCLLGAKLLSLLDHGHNNSNDDDGGSGDFIDPTTEARKREEEGILLVAAGDMLGPPQLIQMAVPSLHHTKSNHDRSISSSSSISGGGDDDDGPRSPVDRESFPIHCIDIPGLQDVNSRVTCVLFVSRTTMGEVLSNAIFQNLDQTQEVAAANPNTNHNHHPLDWNAVIFMGFENGSVQCSLVVGGPSLSSVLSNTSSTTQPITRRMVSCCSATPIHPLGLLGHERVGSIRLMPAGGTKDRPTKFIAVMGSFGTVTVLNGTSTSRMDPIPSNPIVQPPGLPSTPLRGVVWTSATSFSCLAATNSASSKNSSSTPRTATFIATRKDGSTYLYTIDNTGGDDTSSSLSLSSLVRLFVRRNMACVASGRWVQETGVQNVLAFLSWDGLSLSIMKMKEMPWRDINESLSTFTSQASSSVARRRLIHDEERRQHHDVTKEGVIQTMLRDQSHGNLSRADTASSNYTSPYETAKALMDQLSPFLSRQKDSAYYGLPDASNFVNVNHDNGTSGDVASAAMMETRQAFRVVSSIQSQNNTTVNPLEKTNNNVDDESKDEKRPRVDICLHGHNGQMLRAVAKLGTTQQALVSNGSLDSSTSESVWNHSVHMLQSLSPHHHDLSGGKDILEASKQQRPLCFRHMGTAGGGDEAHTLSEPHNREEEDYLEEIPVFYGGTAVSVSRPIHSIASLQEELCSDIPVWDRFPVSAYTSMSTAYTYNMASPNSDGSDVERAKLEVDLSYSYSSRATTMIKKRKRRQDRHVLSQEPGYCKRGRMYNNQRESDSTLFASSEHLGLIVPLTGEANSKDATWDILDSAMTVFNRDQEVNRGDNSNSHDPLFQADCLVQEKGQTINSLHLNRDEIDLPAYLEDCCIASAFQNKCMYGVTEFDSSLGSLSISPVSTFPATIFGPATKMVSQQPILGVDAISVAVTHAEENTTADVSHMIAFAVGGMMDGTELRSIVHLIRAALLRRLGSRYAESANDTSISNREVIGACNSYHEQLLERRTAKAIRYITRTVETASAANNGVSSSVRKETLIRLYERLRSLRLCLG